jgi:hypothetical protein
MQVEIMADGLLKVERNEATFLGIITSIPGRSYALQSFSTERSGPTKRPGWVVRGNEIGEWLPAGFTEHEHRVVVYGPYLEGVTLEETLGRDPAEVLALLERLASAAGLLQERQIPILKLHTRGVIFLNDGGILFLPGELMNTIREHQPIPDQIRYYENMNHPDLEPAQNLSYFFASMVYRAITGQYPYHSDRLEDLHIRVRAGYSIDPVYHDPRIREDLSNDVIAVLRDPGHNLRTPAEWTERLHEWASAGPFQEVTEQGRALLLQQAEARWKRMTRNFKRREFVRKHGKVTVLIVAMVLIIGTIPGTIISKALAPRSTHGYPPEKVVTTFYDSMNSLDQATMQDCVINGAGKSAISEVMNLYVTSRMRMSVDMKTGIVPAQSWVAAGKPPLKASTFVYGVSDLHLTMMTQLPDEVVIAASYLKWQPEFPSPPGQGAGAAKSSSAGGVSGGAASTGAAPAANQEIRNTAHQRKDILHLKKDRGDWVIYRIERQSDKLLPDQTVLSNVR